MFYWWTFYKIKNVCFIGLNKIGVFEFIMSNNRFKVNIEHGTVFSYTWKRSLSFVSKQYISQEITKCDSDDVEFYRHGSLIQTSFENIQNAAYSSRFFISQLLNDFDVHKVNEQSNNPYSAASTKILNSEVMTFDFNDLSILNATAQSIQITDLNFKVQYNALIKTAMAEPSEYLRDGQVIERKMRKHMASESDIQPLI